MSMTTFDGRPQAEISPGRHSRASLAEGVWAGFMFLSAAVSPAERRDRPRRAVRERGHFFMEEMDRAKLRFGKRAGCHSEPRTPRLIPSGPAPFRHEIRSPTTGRA